MGGGYFEISVLVQIQQAESATCRHRSFIECMSILCLAKLTITWMVNMMLPSLEFPDPTH